MLTGEVGVKQELLHVGWLLKETGIGARQVEQHACVVVPQTDDTTQSHADGRTVNRSRVAKPAPSVDSRRADTRHPDQDEVAMPLGKSWNRRALDRRSRLSNAALPASQPRTWDRRGERRTGT